MSDRERRAGLTKDEFAQISWGAFVQWASSDDDCIKAFNHATGRRYRERGVSPSDVELNDDTAAFVRWITENHWGIEFAPAAYRASINA